MRLINCKTLTLETYEHSEAPPYAILSHTWGDDEVLFQDFLLPEVREAEHGWRKIELTCRQAAADGLSHAWVDSCCINKESSSELSESINSMFRWYAHSTHCYVFLTDYHLPPSPSAPRDITSSKWFTRGWTLQELIAPPRLSFFDADWKFVGTKRDLGADIASCTRINLNLLTATTIEDIRIGLDECTVAMRMSWAARRKTKRPEDLAYCLLGIFDLSMPMLYGEGERAFTRLQEMIIQETNDMSIFAWQTSSDFAPATEFSDREEGGAGYSGVLAERPSDFDIGHHIIPSRFPAMIPEYAVTNKGLRIDVKLRQITQGVLFMPLNYHYPSWDPNNAREVGICLRRHGDGIYARVNAGRLLMDPSGTGISHPSQMQIYLVKRLKPSSIKALRAAHRLEFKVTCGLKLVRGQVEPRSQWDTLNEIFVIPSGTSSFVGYQEISVKQPDWSAAEEHFLVILGYEPPDKPWACLANNSKNKQLYGYKYRQLYDAVKSLDMVTSAALGRKHESELRKLRSTTATPHIWTVSMSTVDIDSDGRKITRFNVLVK